MQVSATLIAAQAAAREMRARLAIPQAAQQPGIAAALEKADGFSAPAAEADCGTRAGGRNASSAAGSVRANGAASGY